MNTTKVYKDEGGNALFLILIAVVLFAALSYAITQSNRGGGNVGRETNQIAGTTITQYTSGIRTGITRMLLRGVAVSELKFDPPSISAYNTDPELQVFHPQGGGVGYQKPEANVIAGTIIPEATRDTQNWYFFTNKRVANIGVDATGDVVAVLSDVKKGICEQLNEQIRGTGVTPLVPTSTASPIGSGTGDGSDTVIDGTDGIKGQPFGCVLNGTTYYYYHVLAEQ